MATAKVTPFPSPAQAPATPQPITQAELKARLEAAGPVEPGDHTARLEEHFRRNVAWKDVVIRLADRLGLDGEAYCANVLGNTKPARTVSLYVA